MENLKRNMSDTKILAVAGKGGVGKTSVAATMVRILTEAYPDKKVLAIDADPAVGLSTALGIEAATTIDDIRKEVVNIAQNGDTAGAVELLGDARYRLLDALVESDGFSFIAIGRPESAGCYCKINSYLKEVISILAENFDFVVIDGEAGIEQINRRVMEKVTHLFLITDASKKGRQVIKTIKKVADELVMYEKAGVIVNRISLENKFSLSEIGSELEEDKLQILSFIPSDHELAEFDIKGENVFYLPKTSAIVEGVTKALAEIGIL